VSLLPRVATAAVILGVGLGLGQWVRGLSAWVRTAPARLGFEMMGIEIGLAALALAIAWALPGRVGDRLGLRPSTLPTGVIVALTVGTLGLSHAVDGVLKLTRSLEGSVIVGISRGLDDAAGWPFVVAFFGTAIAPAIGEELLCRGLVQRSLARWIGPAAAIVAASLFFGWLHMELVHGAVATCIGVYLGLAAWLGDSTRPAMAGHAANNLAALLGSAGVLTTRLPLAPAIALGSALAIGALVWAWRARARPPGEPRDGDPPGALQPRPESADC